MAITEVMLERLLLPLLSSFIVSIVHQTVATVALTTAAPALPSASKPHAAEALGGADVLGSAAGGGDARLRRVVGSGEAV